ncbi:MAG: carbohydrate binding domain-containing protein [Lachnospiraceae bacterium]|nr:carbohydrate binding domain-containing protein [Lachnospiraceae bacterium]
MNEMILWYQFNDEAQVGKDSSGNNMHATALGERKPVIANVCGRNAAVFKGGTNGVSYLELPKNLLEGVGDENGLTISTWVCADKAANVWERIFDFGKGQGGPYIFLTRFMRGVCFKNTDIFADARMAAPVNEWMHITMTITGTKGGSLSSAGPRLYINGELAADGFISQTSSGKYKQLREWLATLDDLSNYDCNYIGRSQFAPDADFCGALSDFRMYKGALSEEEIIDLMCTALTNEQILALAKDKFLPTPAKIINGDINLPATLMDGRVKVTWKSDRPDNLSATGKVTAAADAVAVTITATLECTNGDSDTVTKTFHSSILPNELAPYELTIHGDKKVLDISPTLYGLFYEDINNAADGGIYAEMVQNRSFEEFVFDTYNHRSGENAISTGRMHNPLRYWFGDTDKVTAKSEGGLNEHLGLTDADANAYYVEVPAGTTLYNRGFCDNTFKHSMNLKAGEGYDFSIWAKASAPATVKVALLDENDTVISNELTININGDWNKYDGMTLTANKSVMGQLRLTFDGAMAIDMVSLMPQNVWGAKEEELSASAHKNFTGNPNYRLRSDLVKMLVEMNPTFLRFPGGCISEGSYIWDNVYDWKDSVGNVERRKENFNVWGYTMTLGLGYMEYFQLAEDLGAEPLPVMACGVLCQARSDYANPAGGELQKKYIKNFTDLIDFAINTDFDNNEWAALRKEMGHEAPFGLHYLGVGNENWGNEFFASFEAFEHAIDEHMKANYPGYELHIISTAGAQADDNAYKFGWKYLAGFMKGGARVAFTDGKTSFEEDVTWYQYKKDFLDTIVDEHYYRANDYLLENADRYNYYYRAKENGTPDEQRISKVFVGEYASNEKNTLAGAIAEAAVMTGFENNSDVVRLAATAPLFNKVVGDGQYRWTPDAIWFDNESVWRTPTYYVQQLFAQNIGTKLLATSYAHYEAGKKAELKPHGGIVVSAEDGEVLLKKLTVTSNTDGSVIFTQDFTGALSGNFKIIGDASKINVTADGCHIDAVAAKTGFYIDADWSNYKIELTAVKLTDDAQLQLGAGLHSMESDVFSLDKANLTLYCIGDKRHGPGLKVYKDGKEGYTMGDYSSSVYAGNLRSCYDEAVPADAEYVITVDFGGTDGKTLYCDYTDEAGVKQAVLDNKLEAYNREVFNSVTEDNDKVYIKLVNAEDFDKKLKLTLDKLNVKTDAKWIVLTASAEHVHTANVNTKDAEIVVPATRKAVVTDSSMELDLPANSVNIVILNKI